MPESVSAGSPWAVYLHEDEINAIRSALTGELSDRDRVALRRLLQFATAKPIEGKAGHPSAYPANDRK
jgi:hypothetical protein